MGNPSECVFCQIVAKEAPAEILMEWDDALAIEPLNPVTEGHTLILSKCHVFDFNDSPAVSAAVMLRAAEFTFDSGAMNVITSVGKDATQTIFHLHVHVVPRYKGDGLMLPWTGENKDRRLAVVGRATSAELVAELYARITDIPTGSRTLNG